MTIAIEALEKAGLSYEIFDNVSVEPTDTSFKECIAFARNYNADAFLGMNIFRIQGILQNCLKLIA